MGILLLENKKINKNSMECPARNENFPPGKKKNKKITWNLWAASFKSQDLLGQKTCLGSSPTQPDPPLAFPADFLFRSWPIPMFFRVEATLAERLRIPEGAGMLGDARAPQEWCPGAWNELPQRSFQVREAGQDWRSVVGRKHLPTQKAVEGLGLENHTKQGWKSGFQHGKVDSSMEKCPVLCVQEVGEPPGAPKIRDVLGWEVLGEGKGIFYQISVSMENPSPFLVLWNVTEATNPRCCCSL